MPPNFTLIIATANLPLSTTTEYPVGLEFKDKHPGFAAKVKRFPAGTDRPVKRIN